MGAGANTPTQKMSPEWNNRKLSYDGGIVKVILIATGLIVFSMLLIGLMGYRFTEGEVINKLKSKDLFYFIDSIAAKVDGRLERAIETSFVLARDPEIQEWVSSGEPEGPMKERAITRLISLSKQYDYNGFQCKKRQLLVNRRHRTLSSRVGEGSEFRFTLPVHITHEALMNERGGDNAKE